MVLYDVPAPAKINLFLHVVGRRDDGYHLLQTAFRFIDLCDTLHFETRPDGQISCDTSLPGLLPEDDLILRAARALQRATGARQGAHIRCEKKIPAGGGLGGGSSDAATALIALNRLWDTGLDRLELMRLALPLGADVPVFILGQAAFAQGIGEILTPVTLAQRAYVVVQPAQKVPTPAIFAAPELTRNSTCVKMSVFLDRQKNDGYFGRNDLEPVVCARYPRVGRVYLRLGQQGYRARMTGSGACFFIEFVTIEQALMCQQEIIGKMPYSENDGAADIQNTWACQGLEDHPLRYWIRS